MTARLIESQNQYIRERAGAHLGQMNAWNWSSRVGVRFHGRGFEPSSSDGSPTLSVLSPGWIVHEINWFSPFL